MVGLCISFTSAQNDSILLKNGDKLVGEIKSMDRGVMQIETPYSDSDFKIELNGISTLYSNSRFMFTISDGSRYTGTFQSNENDSIDILDDQFGKKVVALSDIVYINSLDNGFLSRLSANVDLGYTLAKANNQQQLTLNFRMGYLADLWSLDGYFNSLFSTQSNVADIERNDFGVGYRYFLPDDWYLLTDVLFLSNTEQNIDLRFNAKVGVGNYVIHSNSAYWGFAGGVAYNNETFSQVMESDTVYTPDPRQSFEGFLATELNLFDIGDLNFFTNIIAYPSFTEKGRWRVDYRLDGKYDDFLLDDFYIRAGFTLNYDNQPAVAGTEVDFIFTTGFGWEW